MDSERLHALVEASGDRQAPDWVSGLIEDFVSGKEATMEASLRNEKAFEDTLAVLQLESFDGDALLGYHIRNTRSEAIIDTAEMVQFATHNEIEALAVDERVEPKKVLWMVHLNFWRRKLVKLFV